MDTEITRLGTMYVLTASQNYSLNIGQNAPKTASYVNTTQFLDRFGEQFCPRVAIRSRWISNRIPIESHAFKSNLLAVKSNRLNRFDRDLNGIAIRTVNHHPMA